LTFQDGPSGIAQPSSASAEQQVTVSTFCRVESCHQEVAVAIPASQDKSQEEFGDISDGDTGLGLED